MSDLSVPAVKGAIAAVPVPDLAPDLGATGAAIETSVTRGRVVVRVTLGFPAAWLRSAPALRPKDQRHRFPKIVVEERK